MEVFEKKEVGCTFKVQLQTQTHYFELNCFRKRKDIYLKVILQLRSSKNHPCRTYSYKTKQIQTMLN